MAGSSPARPPARPGPGASGRDGTPATVGGTRRSPPPLHRRPGRTLYRLFAREARLPSVLALAAFTSVALTQDLLAFADLVINRGLSSWTLTLIAFYQAVPVASYVFPFAVLLGCLVALGRMGADREILALEASGVSATRLLGPVLAFATLASVAALGLSLVAAPWSHRALDAAFESVARARPWAQIRAGTVHHFGDWRLEAREVSSSGSQLAGVLLWVPEVGETIFARGGSLASTPDGEVEITLSGASLLLGARSEPTEMRFEQLRSHLPTHLGPLEVKPWDRVRRLDLAALAREAEAFVPEINQPLPQAALELQRRLALPMATLVFGLLSVPLFLSSRRFSRAAGGVLGLLSTVTYYGLVQVGEGLVQSGHVGVALGVWLPNLVLGGVGLALLVRARREAVLGNSPVPPRSAAARRAARKPRGPASGHRLPLARYVSWRFAELVGLSLAVLLTAYLLIDVMDRLQWFARHEATASEVLRFYAARFPLLASRVVPMALLVGTALTVSLLAADGELLGIRSCGIPVPRALAPMLVLSALVAPAYFALNDFVVPRTNALADELKQTEIKDVFYARYGERLKHGVWYRSGNQVVEAALLDPDRGDARQITIYEVGAEGLPVSRSDARSARHVGRGVWQLIDSARIEVRDGRVRQALAPRFAELGETLPADVDTMHMSVARLARELREVEAGGYDGSAFRVALHARLAAPLACLVLPAVVLFFAAGGPPFPGPAQTLLVSGVLGAAFILLTGAATSLGHGGAVPAFVAGWAPALCYALLSVVLGFRLWRRL